MHINEDYISILLISYLKYGLIKIVKIKYTNNKITLNIVLYLD